MSDVKMGRPEIVWDEKEWLKFQFLCSRMCTKMEICGGMGITDKTLDKLIAERYSEFGEPDAEGNKEMLHRATFSEVYKRESAAGLISLRRAQFKLAETNAAMNIWLSKQFLGQKDKTEVELSGQMINKTADLTDEELAAAIAKFK